MNINLETLPGYMKNLPLDERGYPVPYFVQWVDGKPEFRAMDMQKFANCLKQSVCWVCGTRLGVYKTFVVGPMCGINRISSEPPSHYDCAKWSVLNCPFLNNPRMVRREDEVVNQDTFNENVAGIGLRRNPGVTLLWTTRTYEVLKVENGILMIMGDPEKTEWYSQGRNATRLEVDDSVDSGLPALIAACGGDPLQLKMLNKAVDKFNNYLPE